jgi:hypothetical protein
MGLDIYINSNNGWNRLTLSGVSRVAFTFQVNNIAELKDRQSSFSNQFKIAHSKENDFALEYSAEPQTTGGAQFKKLPCQVILDGSQIIPEGFAIIESHEGGEHALTLYAGIINLFEGLEGKKINELREYSDRHYWDGGAARGSLTFPGNFKYLIVDYGETITGPDIDPALLLPWINRSAIFNKIISSTGFTLNGKPLTMPELLDSYLLAWKKEHPSELFEAIARVDDVDSWTVLNSFIPVVGYAPLYKNIVTDGWAPTAPQLIAVDPIPFSTFAPLDITNFTTFRARATGTYLIELDVEMRMDLGLTANILPGATIGLRKKPAASGYFFDQTVGVEFFNVDNWDGTISPLLVYGQFPAGSEKLHKFSLKVPLQTGDVLLLCGNLHPANSGGGALPILFGNKTEFRVIDITDAPVVPDDYVDPWAMLPDITQKDFIKAIANEMAMTFDVDLMAKACRVYSFGEVVEQMPNAKDWSDKVVNITETRQEFHANTYARENFFKYKTETGQSETLGRSSFVIPDETLEETKDVLTLPWAPVEMVKKVGQLIPFVKLWDADGLEFNDPSELYVLLAQQETTAEALLIDGIPLPAQIPMAWFYIYEKAANLGWVALLLKFYPELIASLQNYLKLTVPLSLESTDVTQINYILPIYLKQFSAYFYLNKINQYKDELTPAKTELIRL